jgi:hypothetical protein
MFLKVVDPSVGHETLPTKSYFLFRIDQDKSFISSYQEIFIDVDSFSLLKYLQHKNETYIFLHPSRYHRLQQSSIFSLQIPSMTTSSKKR